ncbi:hypothetical protein GR241_13845 [Rhizobium leguminosarum]|nr:hypothetical protein [Rhizobium ruizarguesonis]
MSDGFLSEVEKIVADLGARLGASDSRASYEAALFAVLALNDLLDAISDRSISYEVRRASKAECARADVNYQPFEDIPGIGYYLIETYGFRLGVFGDPASGDAVALAIDSEQDAASCLRKFGPLTA